MTTLTKRGPEGTRVLDLSGCTLGFTRLAINGLNEAGMQPMQRGDVSWMCNGEIYNWKHLASQYLLSNYSGSDCEILGELYKKFWGLSIPLAEFFRALDGVFAMVITQGNRVIVARDPYGVRPLYMAIDGERKLFGSEIKSLARVGKCIEAFLPGHYMVFEDGHMVEYKAYHTVPTIKHPLYARVDLAAQAVRESLTCAVMKRLLTDRPVAALLSGGLDSSLVAAIIARERSLTGQSPLETYSIGMAGSQDLYYANMVAKWIGSKHTEIVVTAEQMFDAVPAVIRDIESYDTTTVRASVGNWLVAKAIAERSDAKVVFNGDGSDEVWGSYLYFFNAPSPHAYEAEVTRLLTDIHMFDVLRSDRCISSHGLEPRTPFLDKEFVAVARSVATELRQPYREREQMEKWLMRRAFDNGLLPNEVLWRKKEAFSDGVSGKERSWYQIAQDMAAAKLGYTPVDTTAEKAYYKKLYRDVYGDETMSVNVPYFWMPRWSQATDPSARELKFAT